MKKYIMSLTELDENVICDKREHKDKIGGHPTYLPPGDVEDYDYFVMEIYNRTPIRGNEDILNWWNRFF